MSLVGKIVGPFLIGKFLSIWKKRLKKFAIKHGLIEEKYARDVWHGETDEGRIEHHEG